MRSRLGLRCSFWNVGQGLFSSGCILRENEAVFHWVYDCGTLSGLDLIKSAISKYNNSVKKSDIDLLVLSHFDSDHINGVGELLKNRKVKYWVVPYYPKWQRLVIAAALNIDASDEIFGFYNNPIEYLNRYFDNELSDTEILLLPVQDNEIELIDEDNALSNENNDEMLIFTEDKKQPDEFSSIKSKFKLRWLNPRKALLKKIGNELFEFVLYNVSFYSLIKGMNAKIDIIQFKKCVSEIIQKNSNDPVWELREFYKDVFGESYNKNIISQYLYVREITNDTAYNIIYYPYPYPYLYPYSYYYYYRWYDKSKNAILYTGDASLNKDSLLTDLKKSLGPNRMTKISCLQVPHHGSKHSWHEGLAQKLSPNISVFSSDPRDPRGYSHPNIEVLTDFFLNTPILVNKNFMLELEITSS